MIGFIIGTLCLIGLIKVLRRGRGGGCGRGDRGGRGWGGRGWGGPPWARGGHRRRGGWGGDGAFMYGLFEALDATPAQEKVIREAADELRGGAEGLRGEVRASRGDVAAAVRSPSLDETRIGEVFARHDAALEKMRRAAVGAVARVHAVLDDRQRERLAELLEHGPWAGGRGEGRRHEGPYRSWL